MIPVSKQARSMLAGLLEVFDAIDRVNGLEAHEARLQASVAGLQSKIDAAAAEVAKAREDVNAINQTNAKVVQLADEEAARIKADADDLAAKIVTAAREEAEKAKKAEAFSEAEERRAKKRLGEIQEALDAMAPKVAAAEAIIAKAEAIKRAMG